jgi:DNA-binding MarR family transcriptional regulator
LGTYGAVKKPKKQYPVPRHENVELDVILSIDENPDTSIRQIASEQGTSYGTVQRILKKHKVKPYIPQKVHAIDTRRRSSQKN